MVLVVQWVCLCACGGGGSSSSSSDREGQDQGEGASELGAESNTWRVFLPKHRASVVAAIFVVWYVALQVELV